MVRHGGLIERKAGGEVADADLVLRARQRGEDRQTVRIAERLEKHGVGAPVDRIDRRGRATTLHRMSILVLYRYLSIQDFGPAGMPLPALRNTTGGSNR